MEMSERLGQPDILQLPMSRRDIGDYLGLTIETVSRVFTQLDRGRLIERPSRYVALRNSPALKLMTESTDV
jgi:CRP/FNR family nitrogen fixation transcriptional regulator